MALARAGCRQPEGGVASWPVAAAAVRGQGDASKAVAVTLQLVIGGGIANDVCCARQRLWLRQSLAAGLDVHPLAAARRGCPPAVLYGPLPGSRARDHVPASPHLRSSRGQARAVAMSRPGALHGSVGSPRARLASWQGA